MNESSFDCYDKLLHIRLSFVQHLTAALEHLIICVLVYIVVCLLIYRLLFNNAPATVTQETIVTRLLNSVKFPQHNRVLIVTAHPDDECMFFGPTILSLTSRKDCSVYLLCLSKGAHENDGDVRREELWKACSKLNIKEENITLINAAHLQDGMHLDWSADIISKQILKMIESLDIDAIIAFDRDGVSNHPNHCAMYYSVASICLAGFMPSSCIVYTLDSINLCRKYLSILDLFISILFSTNWFVLANCDRRKVLSAMKEHKSQMLWFRKLYICFSRYMIINSLREMNLSDIQLEEQILDET